MKSKAAPPYPGPDCQAGLAEKLLFLFVGIHGFRVTIFSSTLTFEPVIGYFSSKKIQSHLQLQEARISKFLSHGLADQFFLNFRLTPTMPTNPKLKRSRRVEP